MSKLGKGIAGKVALGAAGALLAFALPTSVFAIGLLQDGGTFSERDSSMSFTPAAADPRVAELIAERGTGKARMMRFTPAGAANSAMGRAVTVAVRVDQQASDVLAARSGAGNAGDSAGRSISLAPTRYNLGLARGYSSFAQAPASSLSTTLSDARIPDLAEFAPSTGVREEPSRFAARVELEEGRRAGRESDARTSVNDQLLDLGGSYRLSRNLDITAGVRIEQDRDLAPLPDLEQTDSQAVYVGTQFRF